MKVSSELDYLNDDNPDNIESNEDLFYDSDNNPEFQEEKVIAICGMKALQTEVVWKLQAVFMNSQKTT
ncbi:hypothetical protein WA026_021568, partial [Henosepilachna vigintioctopunctata]